MKVFVWNVYYLWIQTLGLRTLAYLKYYQGIGDEM